MGINHLHGAEAIEPSQGLLHGHVGPNMIHLAEFAAIGFIGYIIAKNIWKTTVGN